MDNNYVYYDNTLIYNTYKPTRIKTNNINDCISECKYPTCKGIDIYKPNCNNKIYCDNNSKLNNFNCDLITDVNKTNLVKHHLNTISIINKSNFNLHNLENHTFNIKTNNNNKCINFDNNNIAKIHTSCAEFKTNNNNQFFTYNNNNNDKKCLSVNGLHVNLTDCDNNDNQSFIYDTIFNTIRPSHNTNMCLTHNNDIITIDKCSNANINNEQIFNLSKLKSNIDTFNNIDDYTNYDLIFIIFIILILLLFLYYII